MISRRARVPLIATNGPKQTFRRLRSFVRDLLALRAQRGPYRFLVSKWDAIDDVNLAARVLGTEFFSSKLAPVPLDLENIGPVLVVAPHQDDEIIGAGGSLIPELYLHGLSEGDFDLALRGLLGEDAPVSASTVARLKSKWNDELAQWRSRPLDDLEVVYLWVDGVYVKAGLEKEKAAVLVVMAALSDGSKVVVSAVPGYRESTENWSEVLRDIKRRGLSCPRLVVGDGHLGIWGALRNVYPQAAEQRCWNHKIVNVLAKLPKRQQDQAKLMLRTIPYAPTRTEAERLRTVFTRWCGDHSYEAASEALERDWDRMVTFYDFPKEHWGHLRTTNPVESPFAALRLRTDAAKRYKRVDRAIAVIWKMLMVAEQRFRRLKAPELIEDVYLGAQYADGIAIESTAEKVAA